jgi:hypothetical protein
MNIFILNGDPDKIPALMCDQHVVKMILESAQLLSTVKTVYKSQVTYKPTHVKHPCTIWVGASRHNYNWLFRHFCALLDEYKYRYKKDHKCVLLIDELKDCEMMDNGLTDFALAMPVSLKTSDAVQSYQMFYAYKHLFRFEMRYTGRDIPVFLLNYGVLFIRLVIFFHF